MRFPFTSNERFRTGNRFETEAKGNSGMGYSSYISGCEGKSHWGGK